MKTLIEAVEAWIDDRVMAKIESSEKDNPKWMKIAQLMHDVKQLEEEKKASEEIYIRDANRIAELERKILTLENSTGVEDMVTLTERLDIIESTADDALANAEEAQSLAEEAQSIAASADNRIDDQEYRIDELESLSGDAEIDTDEIERNVRSGVEDFIVDAVRTEIDAVDFRITVER